jgi:hypothetical protein
MPFFDQIEDVPRQSATPFVIVCRLFEAASGLGGISFAAFVLTVASSRLPPCWGVINRLALGGVMVSILTFLLGMFRTDGKRRQTMLVGAFFVFVWFIFILAAGTARDF